MIPFRKPPSAAFWATVVVVVALVAYGGAYLALVGPVRLFAGGWVITIPSVFWGPYGSEASPPARDRCLTFFWPALQVDRCLRRSVWPPSRELIPGSADAWTWPSSP
jgi:hypothetical protein